MENDQLVAEMPSIEEQRAECRQWAEYFRAAGYECNAFWVSDQGPDDPFGYEWQVWTNDRDWWLGPIATFDIDGCGASWHGPDDLWMTVVGPHCEFVDDETWRKAHSN